MVLRRWALPLMWAHSVHSSAPKPPSLRLFSQNPLFASARLSPPDGQRHYLFSVMRAREGDRVALFNGIDGEWEAEIVRLNRKGCEFAVRGCLRPQPAPAPAPTLLFGVLKGARLPSLVEKAVELGVGELVPVLTTHCHARALNVQRLQAVATEAAEQCGRLDVRYPARRTRHLGSAEAALRVRHPHGCFAARGTVRRSCACRRHPDRAGGWLGSSRVGGA
jgi:16S rRNA (uracil1498-N3)-methyltransferase